MTRACLVGLLALSMVGCSHDVDSLRVGALDGGIRIDGGDACDGGCCAPTVVTRDTLDLLFMIDNSNSMTEEQASLANELPRLMEMLSQGDSSGDGMEEFPPVKDLHVGAISSDMGTGGFTVPTCTESNFGDDGILRTSGNTAIGGCMANYPAFLQFQADIGQDPAVFAQDFTCVAQMGTGGCGFEQELEAVLKALTPSDSPIAFSMDTTGHGDTENAGFLRPRAMLGIVILTDEEDCSAADPELFNPSSSVYMGNLNLRCFSYPEAVHPVSRYVEGLLATKARPDMLAYVAIAGIPPDLASVSYGEMLDDPRLEEKVDETDPNRLTPSCDTPGRGLAFPPRRIIEVAQGLSGEGASTTVRSICEPDFGPAVVGLVGAIAEIATVEGCED